MTLFSFSHIGNSRNNHEDNYILHKGDFLSPGKRKQIEKKRAVFVHKVKTNGKAFLVAVSDGMGGHSCGEVASLLTVKYLSDNYRKIIQESKDSTALISIFSHLNHTILDYARKNPECKNMGATLCGIVFNNNKITGFNIGDSRMYRFDGGTLTQLSCDHTEGKRLLKLNLITPEEEKSFPRRKYLYKYIGLGGELIADIFEVDEMLNDTTLLLCSDGLTDALSDSEIEDILKLETGLQEKGNTLIEEAVKRNDGRGDNITLIIIGPERRNKICLKKKC